MSRIGKTFKAITEIIRNPWLLNHVLADNTIWKKYVEKNYNISSLPVVDLNTLLPNFKEELNTFAFLEGGSLPTDLCLIRGVCKSVPNCNYFEIGTCRGESVINVADVCNECYTLDLDPKLIADKTEAELIGFFSKSNNNIKQLYGNSLTFDYAGLNKKFDVVFIDGDHHYESVMSDTANVFKHLLNKDSIVIWHDYGYDPVTPRHEVMAAIMDGIPAELRKNLYHVSNTMCAIYTTRQLSATDLTKTRIPSTKFKVSVEGSKLM
ncbi:MAG TPA: class I SAM-dependent methyltransferase [Bacteroidia bacterium]|nr:class I SAM-dependent methyltransferase [Bacteroidia bacterium]